jgi:hypothetical protein
MQQVRQPCCSGWTEARSATELHVAGAARPHTAHHQHVPVRVHLTHAACGAANSERRNQDVQGGREAMQVMELSTLSSAARGRRASNIDQTPAPISCPLLQTRVTRG